MKYEICLLEWQIGMLRDLMPWYAGLRAALTGCYVTRPYNAVYFMTYFYGPMSAVVGYR